MVTDDDDVDNDNDSEMVMMTVVVRAMMLVLSATRTTIAMVMMRCDRPLSTTMFPRGLIAAIRSIPFCCCSSNRRMNLFLTLMFITVSSLLSFYAFP